MHNIKIIHIGLIKLNLFIKLPAYVQTFWLKQQLNVVKIVWEGVCFSSHSQGVSANLKDSYTMNT